MRLASVPATTRLNWTPVMFRSVVRPATFALAVTIRVHVTQDMAWVRNNMRRTDVCAVTDVEQGQISSREAATSKRGAYRKHSRYSMHTGGIRCRSSFRSTFLWSTEVATTSTVTFSVESFSSSDKEEDIVEMRLPRMSERPVRLVPEPAWLIYVSSRPIFHGLRPMGDRPRRRRCRSDTV